MNFTAQANYLRMSPRKVQLVSRLIAGLPVVDAEAQLSTNQKLAAVPIQKLLASAIANTLEQMNIKKEDLVIKEISVGQGPTLHRYKPRAFGRAGKIRKRTSHVSLTLTLRKGVDIDLEKAKKKVTTPAKPTTMEDIEKAAAKAEKGSKKDVTKVKNENKQSTTDETDKKTETQQKGVTQNKKKEGETKPGSKGTDSKFMKKMFSRKVG